jgi:carbamoyl-phosphate synthase large subunit
MPNILITCAGGPVAPYIADSLKDSHIVSLCDASDKHRMANQTTYQFKRVPLGSDPSYLDRMRSLIKEWNIDFVIPIADEELLPLASLHEEGLAICITPNKTFIDICLHKKSLMNILAEKNISLLKAFESESDVQYPAIAKPIYGRGSRAVHRINTPQQLEGYYKLYTREFEDILVQPCIEGVEYTVSVIVNNKNKLIGVVPKRIIEKRGITRSAVSEKNKLIEGVCTRIVEELNPCGPFNVQLKLRDNTCFIFEINPRLSTTAVLTDKAFGNEIELCITYENKKEVQNPPQIKDGVHMYRHEEVVFFNL